MLLIMQNWHSVTLSAHLSPSDAMEDARRVHLTDATRAASSDAMAFDVPVRHADIRAGGAKAMMREVLRNLLRITARGWSVRACSPSLLAFRTPSGKCVVVRVMFETATDEETMRVLAFVTTRTFVSTVERGTLRGEILHAIRRAAMKIAKSDGRGADATAAPACVAT